MSDTETVLQMLQSDDTETVREGAYAAGESGSVDAIELLAQHLHSTNLGIQEAADDALRKIGGPDTVRAVIPLLRSEEAPVRNISMDILRYVGNEDIDSLVNLLKDPDPDIRIFASDILGSTRNLLAVAPLGDALLKDPEVNVRYQAGVSLGSLAFPEAAEYLNKALSDEEWVQFAVIEALKKIKDDSSVSALLKALESSSDLVASMIVEALGEMGNIKAAALLLKRMDDSPTALRNKIVQAIVRIIGGKSLKLLSQNEREKFRHYLLVALQDEDVEIQDAAMQGLSFVGGEYASAAVLKLGASMDPDRDHDRLQRVVDTVAAIGLTQALEDAVRGDDPAEMGTAVEAIVRMGDPQAAGLLMDVFPEKDRDMQRTIIKALNVVGDETALDFFLDVLETHNDGDILKGSVQFIGAYSKNMEAGRKLFTLLEHPFDDVKEAALEACVNLNGPEMIDRFKELFKSPEPINRMMAVYALGKMGAHENMDEIRQALEDEIPDIRKTALDSLRNIKLNTEHDLPLVVNRLHDEHAEVRLSVVKLLTGCNDPVVVPYLERALEDEDSWVRIRSAEALGERKASGSVTKLVPLLEDSNTLVALKVIEALGRIGGSTAFRALLNVLNSDDPELQAAAEEAVAGIQES